MNEHGKDKNEVDITFIVPCLNEENNIIGTIENILGVVNEFNFSYEIIITDDKSTDKTVEIVKDFIKQSPGVPIKLIKNKKVLGLGCNFIEGAFLGKGKYYMLVAGMNCLPKEAIIAILEKKGTADIVVPYFVDNDPRKLYRKMISRLYTGIINLLGGYSLRYYNGSPLHLRYNVMRWSPRTSGHGLFPELLIILLNHGATYTEVPIEITFQKNRSSKAISLQNFSSVILSFINIIIYRIRNKLF